MAGHLGAAAFFGACTAAGQDIESPTTTPTEAPDLTGTYAAEWAAEGDCDELVGGPEEFVNGPLTITGTDGDLVFDFEEASFEGTIDETFTFLVDGSATLDDWTVTLAGEGLAYIAGGLWVLEGDLEMNATNNVASCTVAGDLTATQVGSE